MSGYDDSFRYSFDAWLKKKNHPDALWTEIADLKEKFKAEKAREYYEKTPKKDEFDIPLQNCPVTGEDIFQQYQDYCKENEDLKAPTSRLQKFSVAWKMLQKEVTETATEKGFNPADMNPCTAILLMHAELSEVAEALREGDPADEKCPEFPSSAVEFADVIIRMMVYAETMGLDIPGAVFAKKEFNKTRPYKHGKKF